MKKIYLMVVVLAGLVLGACGSSDSSSNEDRIGNGYNGNNTLYTETAMSEAPVWQVDWSYNQERPNWTEPDPSRYDNPGTTLMVTVEEELMPYVSAGDMMAVFVNNELRGLAPHPAVDAMSGEMSNSDFMMTAYGNESGSERVNISLVYYCQKLNHIFTLTDRISLSSDATTGIDEDYIPEFTRGSAKYPVVKTANVESMMARAGITAVSDNVVGAFVGDECRGVTTLSASGMTQLVVFGRSAGESVTLKYYDSGKKILYTIADAMKM